MELNKQLSLVGITISPDPFSLISEYCHAGSLHDYLRQHSPLNFSFIKELIIGIALGVRHLHQNRIVHRDLASRNVLVTITLFVLIHELTSELVPKVSGIVLFHYIHFD